MVQIDMEMPYNCSMCPMSKFSRLNKLFCAISGKFIKEDLLRRKDCPLREVK